VEELLYNARIRKRRKRYMSKRSRRDHAPAFKAKVALEALKGAMVNSCVLRN